MSLPCWRCIVWTCLGVWWARYRIGCRQRLGSWVIFSNLWTKMIRNLHILPYLLLHTFFFLFLSAKWASSLNPEPFFDTFSVEFFVTTLKFPYLITFLKFLIAKTIFFLPVKHIRCGCCNFLNFFLGQLINAFYFPLLGSNSMCLWLAERLLLWKTRITRESGHVRWLISVRVLVLEHHFSGCIFWIFL